MALITKLDSDCQQFVTFMSTGMRPRSVLASIATAKAIAARLMVPSSPVEDITNYYDISFQIEVTALVSRINEVFITDVDTVLDYARRFYFVRYFCVNPKGNVFCVNPETVVQDFFGLTIAVDARAIEAMKQNPVELTKIYNGTTKLLEQLSAQ